MRLFIIRFFAFLLSTSFLCSLYSEEKMFKASFIDSVCSCSRTKIYCYSFFADGSYDESEEDLSANAEVYFVGCANIAKRREDAIRENLIGTSVSTNRFPEIYTVSCGDDDKTFYYRREVRDLKINGTYFWTNIAKLYDRQKCQDLKNKIKTGLEFYLLGLEVLANNPSFSD